MQKETTRKYEIRRPLGKGGFGTVYLAHLVGPGGFEKPVALKMLHANMEEIDEIAMRMRDEARMMGLLNHRAIVKVDGLVILEGRWTIVMEFVRGVELAELVEAGTPVPAGVAMEIIGEVASALDTAYSEPTGPGGQPLRVLHRDIKPANIQLTAKGEVKVLDFGIARAEFNNREAETAEMMFGSQLYMSPERFDLLDTHEGDIYALGLVLYELLTCTSFGKAQVMPKRHDKAMVKAVGTMGDVGVPEEVQQLLVEMLNYEHEHRPDAKSVARTCRGLVRSLGGISLIDWAEDTIPPILEGREALDPDKMSGRTLLEVPLRRDLKLGNTLGEAAEEEPAPAPPPPAAPAPATDANASLAPTDEFSRDNTASIAVTAGKATLVGGTLVGIGGALLVIILLLGGILFMLLDPLGNGEGSPETEGGDPEVVAEAPDPDGVESPDDDPSESADGGGTASESAGSAGDGTADAADAGQTDPTEEPAEDGAASAGGDAGCGDETSLLAKAERGQLDASEAECLQTAAMAASKQTERKRLGRLVLIHHSAACGNGVNCGGYETYQRIYFAEIDRSDAEMMYQFARHLHGKKPRSEANNKEVMLWARRALDSKTQWKASQFVVRVDELNEINARAAYDQWATAEKTGSSKAEKYRKDARTAAVDWLSYRNQLGKDSTAAEKLCASVSGTDEICKMQATPKAADVVMTFVSVPIGATVHIDGEVRGKAPLTTEVKPGARELKYVYDDGKTGTKSITVGTKEPVRYIWRSAEDSWVEGF